MEMDQIKWQERKRYTQAKFSAVHAFRIFKGGTQIVTKMGIIGLLMNVL
jgi:hypothetical protein